MADRDPRTGPLTRAAVFSPLEAALAELDRGRAVAFPTETVWGLAVCARSEAAMAVLRTWKGRDAEQPVSVLVSGLSALAANRIVLSSLGRRLVAAHWPGPLTLVVPCAERFASGVAGPGGALGLRCSTHPAAAALARAAEGAGLGPLTATSLNRSGESPACDLEGARALCRSEAGPHLFEASLGDAGGAMPTTVIDLTPDPAQVLRWGGIDARALAVFGTAIDTTG